jgi:hypothetical protein
VICTEFAVCPLIDTLKDIYSSKLEELKGDYKNFRDESGNSDPRDYAKKGQTVVYWEKCTQNSPDCDVLKTLKQLKKLSK